MDFGDIKPFLFKLDMNRNMCLIIREHKTNSSISEDRGTGIPEPLNSACVHDSLQSVKLSVKRRTDLDVSGSRRTGRPQINS